MRLILLLIFTLPAFASQLIFELPKNDAYQFYSSNIEIIPTKLTEKTVSYKNRHGQTKSRKVSITPIEVSDKNKENVKKYLVSVSEHILKSLPEFKMPKVKKVEKGKNNVYPIEAWFKNKIKKGDCLVCKEQLE